MNKSNLIPETIAQQALAQFGESKFLEQMAAGGYYSAFKRTLCERIVRDRTVTDYSRIRVEINTMRDVLNFVEAVALFTADTAEHDFFSDIEVYADEEYLTHTAKRVRGATPEELRKAEEWLAANKQEAEQPIKWRQFVPINEYVKVIDNNGDVNND